MADDSISEDVRARKAASAREYYKQNSERLRKAAAERYRAKNIGDALRARYANDPEYRERIKAKAREDWAKNSDRIRRRRKNNPSTQANERAYRSRPETKSKLRAILLRKYGLTVDQYDKMLSDQMGVCAICRNRETARDRWDSGINNLRVDHDHDTGMVRGLLCSNCNTGIGKFREDISVLRRALEYLEGRHD